MCVCVAVYISKAELCFRSTDCSASGSLLCYCCDDDCDGNRKPKKDKAGQGESSRVESSRAEPSRWSVWCPCSSRMPSVDLSCSTECRAQMHLNLYRWIYIYIYICTHVCVCVRASRPAESNSGAFVLLSLPWSPKRKSHPELQLFITTVALFRILGAHKGVCMNVSCSICTGSLALFFFFFFFFPCLI